MFCSRCGRSLPDGAVFCPNCGATVPGAGAAPAGAGAEVPAASAPAAATAAAVTAAGVPAASAPADVAASASVRYGGFWRRLAAYLIDGFLLSVVLWPFGFGFGLASLGGLADGDLNEVDLAGLFFASLFVWFLRLLVSWLYSALLESSPKQATVGKMALGLRVTDRMGRRISFARATGRYLGKIVSGLILGIGFLMVAFTEKKQGLHDMMAATTVRRG